MNQELLIQRYTDLLGAEVESNQHVFTPCISIQFNYLLPPPSDELTAVSKLGGNPRLPKGVQAPFDRQSRPMMFAAQLNMADIPAMEDLPLPRQGILYWFLNSQLKFEKPKERSNFQLVWAPQPAAFAAPLSVGSPYPFARPLAFEPCLSARWNESENMAAGLSCQREIERLSSHRLFGEMKDYAIAKEICAFAMNGVDWSPTRSKDWCYEHLVAAAPSYKLLWFLPASISSSLLPDLALFIRDEDLVAGELNKAWMLPL